MKRTQIVLAALLVAVTSAVQAQTYPHTFWSNRGTIVSGTLSDLYNSDNSRIVLQSRFQFFPPPAQTDLRANATSPITWPVNSMILVVERATAPWPPLGVNHYMRVSLRNRTTGAFEPVWQSGILWVSDFVTTIPIVNPNNYIDPVSLQVEAWLLWGADEPWNSSGVPVFGATVDQVVFYIQ